MSDVVTITTYIKEKTYKKENKILSSIIVTNTSKIALLTIVHLDCVYKYVYFLTVFANTTINLKTLVSYILEAIYQCIYKKQHEK